MSLVAGRVLLTGATGGIGQAIARAFAGRGATLVLSGRRSEMLEALAAEVGGHAVSGDIDVLVANAALPASGTLTDLSQEQIDRMVEINLRAPIALARATAPAMISRGRGHMVFISSLAGKVASPASAIYSATKFGLRGFALGIREDLRSHGVGVSVVLPGFIRQAGMFADANIELPRGVGTRTPEHVARAVIQAVERNRGEVEVAPLGLRLGAGFASLAPELAATVSRKVGGGRVATDLAAGQADKR